MIMEPKQAIHYNYFDVFLLCSYYVIDMIKKLELCFKIGFGHVQISMPKISTIMLKIACINPYFHHPLIF